MTPPRAVVLGFLPWRDPERQVDVTENPAALAGEACARELGVPFVPVEVSTAGISRAIDRVRNLAPDVVVALGQTSTEPRVERQGRVPMADAPAEPGEESPWTIAADAEALTRHLNTLSDPAALLAPFRASDDAGGYFCDHLCVELGREARRRSVVARFLHVTAIDGCAPEVRAARLRQYVKQVRATVEWLASGKAS